MSVDAATPLLRWYDRHQRALPWRTAGMADPYGVWLSEVMLQQTTVAAVRKYYDAFTTRWPTIQDLAAADDHAVMTAWAGLGYYARARNLLACARAVAARGSFPDTEAGLRELPGIGRYTAAAIAFGRRAVVVDGNVERVVARLFALTAPPPAAKADIYRLTDRLTPAARAGDFAQAMMDLGATICTPRRPACALCPLAELCAGRRTGAPETFPRKAARSARPERRGLAWWLERNGRVLLVRRPAKGLLAGMLALPTAGWGGGPEIVSPPVPAQWEMAGAVRHIFTHFALDLALHCAELPPHGAGPSGQWWPIDDLEQAGLPTAFAKLIPLGRAWRARSAADQLDMNKAPALLG